MRINAAYKEALKKILETGDMSRVKRDTVERSDGLRLVLFWIPPAGSERADGIVEGAYPLAPQRLSDAEAEKSELVAQVADAIKEFLSRAKEAQEYDEVTGEAMLALAEWQKAYKECADAQRECSILIGSDKDFQAARKVAQSSIADEDARRSARVKMRIIKKRIIEENRAVFERCYKAQEELEKARKKIQAQVESDALEYQEPVSDE